MRLSILVMLGAMVFAEWSADAMATPVFARQTGMACSSCHFQHFPLLNGFGRAFKSAGFAMMGAQARIESDDLSIPVSLNMSVLTMAGYEKSNQAKSALMGAEPAKTAGDGLFYLPGSGGQLSVFFGGRLSENAGFLGELGSVRVNDAHSSAKMPLQFDLAGFVPILPLGTRAGVVPFVTDAHGASYGFELLNTGANAVQQMSVVSGFNRAYAGAISAQQYLATDGPAKGLAFVVSSPMGFLNVTKYDRTGIDQPAFTAMSSTYMRIAGIIPLAGWDTVALGVQSWSGKSAVADPAGLTPLVNVATEAYAVDAQLQGRMGELPIGVYVTYARAPAVLLSATNQLGNAYNTYLSQDALGSPVVVTGSKEKTSFNIATEIGIVPDVATFGIAMRRGVNGDGLSDNAIMLTGTYQMAQNMLLSLSFTDASGDYWYSNVANNGTIDQVGKTTYTINLSTAF